jgi:hypothetical protein
MMAQTPTPLDEQAPLPPSSPSEFDTNASTAAAPDAVPASAAGAEGASDDSPTPAAGAGDANAAPDDASSADDDAASEEADGAEGASGDAAKAGGDGAKKKRRARLDRFNPRLLRRRDGCDYTVADDDVFAPAATRGLPNVRHIGNQ